MKIYDALLKIKECPDEQYGICTNLHLRCENLSQTGYVSLFLEQSFPNWDKFSGSLHLPIPEVDGLNHRYGKLWDKTTQYGRLRWELLDFLIECAKEEGV